VPSDLHSPDSQPIFPPPHAPPKQAGLFARLRNWFLAGLVIAGPLAVTIWLVWWFVNTVDQWVKPLVPPSLWPDVYLPVRVPGTGVLLAIMGLVLLGFLATNIAGRTLLTLGEGMLDGMPIVRGLYRSVKQIFETIFSQSGTSFRRVGLVQYPAPGMWSIVFISTPPIAQINEVLPQSETYLSVFLPCSPNPTTGFYFYLPAREVVEINLTPDDAAKLIMSAGLILPEEQAKLAALASAASTGASK
jgi:uncharacterized membrane protein